MYDSTSHIAPGYRFQYHVPPKSPPFSTTRMPSTPACRSRAPASSPPNPPPMTTTSTSSSNGSRVDVATYGSSRKWANVPAMSWYWSLPSVRNRLSRSYRYFSRSASGSSVRSPIASVMTRS